MYRVSPKVHSVSEVELTEFCQQFPNVPLDGYAAFLRKYGKGTYCDFMHIFGPSYCLSETEANRKLYREHNFWDDESDVLTQLERAESLTLGMSMDGDVMVAHPKRSDRLFIVPRHDSLMFWTPASLAEPMHWMSLRGDKLTTPSFEYFTPDVDRSYFEFHHSRDENHFRSPYRLSGPEFSSCVRSDALADREAPDWPFEQNMGTVPELHHRRGDLHAI